MMIYKENIFLLLHKLIQLLKAANRTCVWVFGAKRLAPLITRGFANVTIYVANSDSDRARTSTGLIYSRGQKILDRGEEGRSWNSTNLDRPLDLVSRKINHQVRRPGWLSDK